MTRPRSPFAVRCSQRTHSSTSKPRRGRLVALRFLCRPRGRNDALDWGWGPRPRLTSAQRAPARR